MAWTPYQEALQQEMIALMTEPSWYSQPSITSRLQEIRTALASAGATIPDQDTKINELLTQFNTAKDQATAANEARYSQLTTGQNPFTAGSQTNTLLNQYYKPIETAAGNIATQYGTTTGDINTGWQNRQTTGTNTANTAINDYVSKLTGAGGLADKYAGRTAELKSYLSQFGDTARQDLSDKWAATRSKSEQDLVNRGLGNSTILASTASGMASKEARDSAALEDTLARQKADYYGQWTGQELAGQEGAVSNAYNAQMGGAQFGAQLAGDTLGARTNAANQTATLQQVPLAYQAQTANTANQYLGGLFNTIQNRQDVAPSLSDIANLTLQLGRGSANTYSLPALTALTAYPNYSGTQK